MVSRIRNLCRLHFAMELKKALQTLTVDGMVLLFDKMGNMSLPQKARCVVWLPVIFFHIKTFVFYSKLPRVIQESSDDILNLSVFWNIQDLPTINSDADHLPNQTGFIYIALCNYIRCIKVDIYIWFVVTFRLVASVTYSYHLAVMDFDVTVRISSTYPSPWLLGTTHVLAESDMKTHYRHFPTQKG